ncbi:Serine/threonine-protein kinase pkn1 [Enterobacter ludwigii]|nr:Serine/threonine-protein kinase pkn1 [Enterobacter ludwigii]
MGDFGAKYGPEKIQLDAQKDSKPLHKVTLSNYSISKFKTTNQEYQLYLNLNGLQLKQEDNPLLQEWADALNKLPDTPAHMDWYDAEKYCAWLGKVSGLPFALPTEAQWEYAARNRGSSLLLEPIAVYWRWMGSSVELIFPAHWIVRSLPGRWGLVLK